jgi:hypothetical protein
MKNLCHAHLFELVMSLLLWGIQMGEMSKLGWLIRLVKNAIRADSLYFLYLPLLSISRILASTQLPLWSSGQSSWLQIQMSGLDSQRYPIF